MKPIIFLKPKKVEISEFQDSLWVKVTDSKGKYYPLLIDADAVVYVANPPEKRNASRLTM